MTKDIIVARYKEDIAWIKDDRLKDFNVIVYDKGNEPKPAIKETPVINKRGKKKVASIVNKEIELPKAPEGFVYLPNTGREAHTYLTHIVNNYNTLADINIFTQGWPFDHVPDFFEKLSTSLPYYDFGQKTLKNKVETNAVTRAGALIFGDNIAPIIFDILKEHGPDAVKRQIKTEGYAVVDVNYYAIFGVDKATIHKYPIEFYKKLLKLTVDSPHGAYIMEFLWVILYA